MPASNELFSFNDVAVEVAAGRMAWSGAAQSGSYAITWSQFTTYVMNDGTNPSGYISNQCIPFSYAQAHAVVIPLNVTLTLARNCVACTYSVSGSWSSRPAGWSAFVNFDGGGFTNMGQIDSYTWSIANVTHDYSFVIYYSNGITNTAQVTSTIAHMTVCSACPQ